MKSQLAFPSPPPCFDATRLNTEQWRLALPGAIKAADQAVRQTTPALSLRSYALLTARNYLPNAFSPFAKRIRLSQTYPFFQADKVQTALNFIATGRFIETNHEKDFWQLVMTCPAWERTLIAEVALKKAPRHMGAAFRRFQCDDERVRCVLAHTLGKASWETLAQNIGNFNLPVKMRLQLALTLAHHDAKLIGIYLHNFNLPEESQRLAVVRVAARTDVEHTVRLRSNYQLSGKSAQQTFIASCLAQAKNRIQAAVLLGHLNPSNRHEFAQVIRSLSDRNLLSAREIKLLTQQSRGLRLNIQGLRLCLAQPEHEARDYHELLCKRAGLPIFPLRKLPDNTLNEFYHDVFELMGSEALPFFEHTTLSAEVFGFTHFKALASWVRKLTYYINAHLDSASARAALKRALSGQTITIQNLTEWEHYISSITARHLGEILQVPSTLLTADALAHLDSDWQILATGQILMRRYQANPNYAAALPILGHIFYACTEDRFYQHKYEGHPNDPLDQAAAAAQLAPLNKAAKRYWQQQHTRLDFVGHGAAASMILAVLDDHPHGFLNIGKSIGLATCLHPEFGGHIEAILANAIDANIKNLRGYVLTSAHFRNPTELMTIYAASQRHTITTHFEGAWQRASFSWETDAGIKQISTRPLQQAQRRELVKVGYAAHNKPGLLPEPAYTCEHELDRLIQRTASNLLHELAPKLNATLASKISLPASRSPFGVNSDLMGGLMQGAHHILAEQY